MDYYKCQGYLKLKVDHADVPEGCLSWIIPANRKRPPTTIPQQWKRRFFVLQRNLTNQAENSMQLVYYKDDKAKKPLSAINLDSCAEIQSSLESPHYEHLFSVKTQHKGRERTYFLAASSADEMNSWVEALIEVLGLQEPVDVTPTALSSSPPPLVHNVPASLHVPASGRPAAPANEDYQPIWTDDPSTLNSVPLEMAPLPPRKGPTQPAITSTHNMPRSQDTTGLYDAPPLRSVPPPTQCIHQPARKRMDPPPTTDSTYNTLPSRCSGGFQSSQERRASSTYDVPPMTRPGAALEPLKPPPGASLTDLCRDDSDSMYETRDSTYDYPPTHGVPEPRDSTYDVPPTHGVPEPTYENRESTYPFPPSRCGPEDDDTYNTPPSHRPAQTSARSSRHSGSSRDSHGSSEGAGVMDGMYDTPKAVQQFKSPPSLATGKAVPPPSAHQTFKPPPKYANVDGDTDTLEAPPTGPYPRKLSDAQKMQAVPPVAPFGMTHGSDPRLHEYVNATGTLKSIEVPAYNAGSRNSYLPMKSKPSYVPPGKTEGLPGYLPMTGVHDQERDSVTSVDDDIYSVQPSNIEIDSVYQVPPARQPQLKEQIPTPRQSQKKEPIPRQSQQNGLNNTVPPPPNTGRKHPTHDIVPLTVTPRSLDTTVPVATPGSPAEVSHYITNKESNIPPSVSQKTRSFRRDIRPPPPIPKSQVVVLPQRRQVSSSSEESSDTDSEDSQVQPPPAKPSLLSSPPPPTKAKPARLPPVKNENALQYIDLDLRDKYPDSTTHPPGRSPGGRSPGGRSPGGSTPFRHQVGSPIEYREIDFTKTEALSVTKKEVEDKRKISDRSMDD